MLLIKKYILILIFLFNSIIFIKSKQIILPFKTETNNEISNYIESLIDNRIYITTEIGEPPQNINLYLTMDSCFLMVTNSSLDSSYYNSYKSKTYLNKSKTTYYFEYFSNAYHSTENFIFQTSYDNSQRKTFNDIEFIHVLEYNINNYISSGYFGLQFPKKNKMNIFENLKKSNVISSPIFNLYYTTDKEGYLSIGELPSQNNDEKNTYSIKRTKPLPCTSDGGLNSDLCWYLKFNDIKFGDIKANRDRGAEIVPEIGFIKGTLDYKEKIIGNYFNKELETKCQLKKYEQLFLYYECDKNTNISTFKDLVFSHEEFMCDFILTKDDLFTQYGDKLYFLIVFDQHLSHGNNWELGKPFIKKYNFSYDISNKLIYYYDKNAKEKEKENKMFYKKNTLIYWIIIGILGLSVIIMIALVLGKDIFKPKKKLANELKEDIDYLYQENKEVNKETSLGIS